MPDPIVPLLPQYQKSFERKWQEIAPAVTHLPKPVTQSIYNFDLQRVAQGRQPLTREQTALALAAATKGEAITKPESPGMWERVVNDVRAIGSSIPRIPGAIVHEVASLPQAPAAISDALGAGSIGQIVSQLSQAPGVRMVPGAYTVGNIAGGHAGELLKHPVFTALDVIPALHSGPGQAVLEPVIGKASQIARPVTEAIGRTAPGAFVKEAFGKEARQVARMEAQTNMALRDALNVDGLPNPDLDVQLAREATGLRKEFSDLSDDEVRTVTQVMQESPHLIPDLPDRQLALAYRSKDLASRFAKARSDERLITSIGGEHYDTATAGRILKHQGNAERTRMVASVRERVLSPTDNLDSLLDEASKNVVKEGLTKKQVKTLAEGYAHAIDAAGYDPAPLMRVIRHRAIEPEGIANAFREYADSPLSSPQHAVEEMLAKVQPHTRTDPMAARLKQAILSEDWDGARDIARTINKRATYRLPDIEEVARGLQRRAQRQKWLGKTTSFTEKAATKAEARAAQVLAESPPARFHPLLSKAIEDRYMAAYSSRPDFDTLIPLIKERNYELLPGWEKSEHSALIKDVKKTWQDLRDGGADPIFVHKITPGMAAKAKYPRALEVANSLSQVKARTFDITPSVEDVTVSLSHQGMEVLSRKASENLVNQIVGTLDEATGKYVGGWGRTQRELIEDYLPAARRMAEANPMLDVRAQAQALMLQDYAKFDPKSIIPWGSPKVSLFSGDDILLPKHIANTIKRLHAPSAGKLTAVLDPVMKVFRTSLLPLSPRWHVYNIVGGATMLMGRTDPFVLKFAKQARQMIEDGTLPEELALGRGMGSAPREAVEWNYRAGGTMRRWWDEIQASKPKAAPGMEALESASKSLKPVVDKAGNIIQKSYDMNAWFDDTYRVMAYLYGENKALTKGLTKEASVEQGLQLARKVMMDWDGMTPIERTIMRNVFPFYGWMRHILKYTMSYPWDHPLRASIVSTFARNELEDMKDGLPYTFLNSIKLGETDSNGNVKTFKFGGMNPFGDFADYFTLAGFTKSLGPIGGTVLEALGIDPMQGAPELYPSVGYDASTGQLAPTGGNIITKFMQNTIPQTELLRGMLHNKSEFQTLLAKNPAAAGRMITGTLGIPTPYREVNIPTEIAKGELKRLETQDTVKGEALKSGDYSRAQHFPGLKAMFDQIEALQGQKELEPYTPQTEGASLTSAAQRALAGRV